MKVVLFIGHFKTGSTSIQGFLSSNFLSLLRAGILYPSVESQGLAHNMNVMISGHDISSIGSGLNVTEPHNALALRLKNEEDKHEIPPYYPSLPSGFQMLETIGNQISELQPRAMVLCSEVFSLLGMTEKRTSIRRLSNRFSEHDVTIYCNLRRPDEYLSSWHRQRLKFGGNLKRLAEGGMKSYLNTPHVQQGKMIEGWIKDYFPNARLVVRNFDSVKKEGGSVRDFITQSELEFPQGLVFEEDKNPSVPNAFAEIGRRAINDLPREMSALVVHWLTDARRRVDYPNDDQVEMFGSQNRQILVDTFHPIAKHINELTSSQNFYPDIDNFGCCNLIPELDAAHEVLSDLVEDAVNMQLPKEVTVWLRGLKVH